MVEVAKIARIFNSVPSAAATRGAPLDFLEFDARTQAALADLLEAIADALPDRVSRATAATAARLLRDAAMRHAAISEAAVFPIIECGSAETAMARRVVAVARREHAEAIGSAIELSEALELLALDGFVQNPESLGFMLRAHFDGLRRRMAWEEAALSPLVREAMADAVNAALYGDRLAALADVEGPPPGFAVIDGGLAEGFSGEAR